MDDDDWDISSLIEEKSLGKITGKEQREPPPVKHESHLAQVPTAWGAPAPRGPKREGVLLWSLVEARSIFQLLRFIFINI